MATPPLPVPLAPKGRRAGGGEGACSNGMPTTLGSQF